MNDQTPLPAPGWYADPAAPETALRYWDGTDWTEHVHALEPQPTAAENPAAAPAADAASEPAAGAEAAPEPAAAAGTAATGTAATDAPAPDTDVPSAEEVGPAGSEPAGLSAPAAAQEEPAAPDAAPQPLGETAAPAAEHTGPAAQQAAAPSNPYAQQQPAPDPASRENPYAQHAPQPNADAHPNPYAQPSPYGAPQNPYAQQTQPQNPSAQPTQQPNPYATPQPPTAPWAQGPGNPYQSPQQAQYGAQPGAPTSRKGLWIGLGIGGGVLVLFVILIIVAVVTFFNGITSSMRDLPDFPRPSYGAEEPPGEDTPPIDGEVFAMGDTFLVPSPDSIGGDWELTMTDFSVDAAEAALAAPGNRAFAVLVEATNVADQASAPWVDLNPYFLASDGIEYYDLGMIEPGMFDIETIEPGGSTQFTLTFEVPEEVADAGTVRIYDAYLDAFAAVEVG